MLHCPWEDVALVYIGDCWYAQRAFSTFRGPLLHLQLLVGVEGW